MHASTDAGAAGEPESQAAHTLLLFDIDGTLLRGGNGAHRRALVGALTSVHGIEAGDLHLRVAPAGRTDGDIARAILLDAGISAAQIDERMDAVQAESCRLYAELCEEDLSPYLIDGIADLLESLAARKDLLLSLVTGNFESIARLKLSRAGIGRWFAPGQGAFGSDCEDRATLPAIARRRAGTGGVPFARAHTIVIGDTPRDIACARADGVRCIAVTSGPFEAHELAGADLVATDAASLRDSICRGLASCR
jgi:phosphoglycolate phosphatase-like HAD superfamily hydrolase